MKPYRNPGLTVLIGFIVSTLISVLQSLGQLVVGRPTGNLIPITIQGRSQSVAVVLESPDLRNWRTNSTPTIPESGTLTIEVEAQPLARFFRILSEDGETEPVGSVFAQSTGFGQAMVEWQGNATNWLGVSVYRQEVGESSSLPELVGEVESDVQELMDPSVPRGSFKYLVGAYRILGDEVVESDAVASNTILVDGLPRLPAPSAISVTNTASGRVLVTWNYDSHTSDGFRVYRGLVAEELLDPDDGFTTFGEAGVVDPDQRVFIDEGVWAGRYRYSVVAFRGEEDEEEEGDPIISEVVEVAGRSPLFAPHGVVAESAGFGQVRVRWTDMNYGKSSHRVYRVPVNRIQEPLLVEGAGEEWEEDDDVWDDVEAVGDALPEQSEFIDLGVPRGNYIYLVSAFREVDEEEEESWHDHSRPLFVDGRPLLISPGDVFATNPAFGSVRVTWRDNSEDENGFRIYRVSLDFVSDDYVSEENIEDDVDGLDALEVELVGTVAANQRVFDDVGVPSGRFRYLVAAYRAVDDDDEESEGGESNEVGVEGLERPGKPVVLQSGLGTADLMPVHRWQAVPNAARVEFEVAVLREAGWVTIEERRVYLAGTSTSYRTVRAYTSPPRTLRWRVRGHNRAGAGAWSDWCDLFLVIAPTTANCGISSADLTPTHRWNSIPNARFVEFEVQVQRSGVWETIESRRRTDLPGGSTEYTEPAYTIPPRTLRWRVRGVYLHGASPWSDWCGYNLLIDVPPKPVLLGCGQTTGDLTPLHRWEPVPRAEVIQFEVEVLRAEGWSAIGERQTNLVGSAVSFQTSRAYTSPPRSLRWRIRGMNSTGAGAWSDWCALDLVLSQPVTLNCGRTSSDLTPTHRWQGVPDARFVDFEVQLLGSDGWTTIASRSRADIPGSATEYTEPAYTRPPRTLRWRIRGRYSWGVGPWSDWCGYNLVP